MIDRAIAVTGSERRRDRITLLSDVAGRQTLTFAAGGLTGISYIDLQVRSKSDESQVATGNESHCMFPCPDAF
ncbi:hypothetical protein CAP48_12915 [Advenella sp. S44]|nr:hypothetical protein CAP48_12915 [Advenella sp. S44]